MQHDRPGSQPEDEGGEHGNDQSRTARAMSSCPRRSVSWKTKWRCCAGKLNDSPRHTRLLEQRLAEASERVSQLTERNTKLVETLREARGQLLALREEVDRLAQPPSGYGVFLDRYEDGTVDVFTSGRRMRVAVSPAVEGERCRCGQSVRLNEALTVVEGGGFERTGEVCTLREVLAGRVEGGSAARAGGRTRRRGAGGVLADPLAEPPIKPGDSLLVDGKAGYAYERVPKAEVEDLVLEEVPDVRYEDIGGLFRQIEQIRDAVELPFLHADLFNEYKLRPPKGVLLYGPPGCGKTLIAKAVANSLAKQVALARGDDDGQAKSYFLNIKGPELLNKFVGETERHIRLIFQRAREKASEGTPVIVFFDEMDSIFRTRGSRRVFRRGDHDRAAAAVGDRRCRGAGERHRHRRLQPRGHDRPGHPAAGPARREDQDRAAGRRGARRTSSPSTWPTDLPIHADDLREFGGDRQVTDRRDDPAHGRADVRRERGEPVPGGDLRQRGQGGPVLP